MPTVLNRLGAAWNAFAGRPGVADTPASDPTQPTAGRSPDPTSKEIPLDDGSGRSVPKTAEALAGGYGGLASVGATVALGRYTDEAQRRYGDRVWDHIRRDPAAGGSVDLLCYATFANDLTVIPAVQLAAGLTAETPEQEADVATSAKIAGYVTRVLRGLATPIHTTGLRQLRGALEYGADVADKVWMIPETGDDAGQLVLKDVKPKERRAWAFEVDAYWNLIYVLGAFGSAGWARWPREKFAVLTWGGRGGDPRGESIYSRAAEAWNFRAQMPEDHFRFLKRFGTPKVVGKLSQSSMAGGDDANPLNARTTNPLTAFLNRILQWINGSALAVGVGDTVEVHDVKSEGQAFAAAMDLYRREIIIAILLQARATMEAAHGSKADSETSSDVLGNLIKYLRRFYCRMAEWDIFYFIVAYRYGAEVAAKHTPSASLGEVEHQDVADLLTGLGHVGYTVQQSQFPSIDKYIGTYAVRTAADVSQEVAGGGDEGETGGKSGAGGEGASDAARNKEEEYARKKAA